MRRFLRLLLLAHPPWARRRYGNEIVETAVERLAQDHRSAPVLAARECIGVVAAGLKMRLEEVRARRSPKRRRGGTTMRELAHHFRLSARSFLRQPVFTVVAVLALALGIGASVAIFTVFHAVLLRPLPFREPDRLVSVWEKNPERGWHQAQVAAANYLDWRSSARSFSDMAGYNDWLDEKVLLIEGKPSVVNASEVTGNFFDVLGISPAIGRGFDDSHTWATEEAAVVLTHRFWQRELGGAETAIGRTIRLDDTDHRILGVMPRGFAYPFADADVWVPVAWDPENRDQVWFRRAHGMRVLGRLQEGVSPEAAESELAAIASRLDAEYPETNRLMGNGITPLQEWIVGDTSRPLHILITAVGLLLLIACANVANMMLARGAGREHEIRIKSALGGGRTRLLFEGLGESLVLAGFSGTLGLALGILAIRPLLALSPEGLPRMEEIGVDPTVVLFAVGVTLASALLCGSIPSWRGASAALVSGARGATRARRTNRATAFLVGAEVALTLPLVVGAGLMARTLWHLTDVDPGFVADNVLVARVSLPGDRYRDDARVAAFYRQLMDAVGDAAGVDSAALSSRLPFWNPRWSSDFTAEGWPTNRYGIGVRHDEVTPGLFRTMGIPLLKGRDFDLSDDLGAPPVVIINQALAEKYFAAEDPLGKRVCFDRTPDEDSVWRTIVGVVGNVRREALSVEEEPSFYAPVLQDTTRAIHVIVRADRGPLALVDSVRETVHSIDPVVPLFDITTLEAVVRSSMARERFLLSLLAAAAGLALALASIGIFGVVLYSTTRRVREIGIRMALGARGASVVGLVVGRGMRPVLAGIAAGILAAVLGVRALSTFLFEVEPLDLATFAAVVTVVLTAGLAACAIPARWATRVEASSALRAE
ncbi:MAG TPA: ABC transporter permease [Vicinamibacteria bacterium]|nr:ABC transporter permease [Vicinamibacteria bacterium]